jgi:hypothetical protein
MDLAVTLPLAVLLALQCLTALGLLLPRAASKHVAGLLASINASTGTRSAVLTVAGAVAAMTVSACIQLVGVVDTLKGSQFGDRLVGQRSGWVGSPSAKGCAKVSWMPAAQFCMFGVAADRGPLISLPFCPGLACARRALALTVEQLRALLVVAMGTSNLVLLFLCKALALEQIAGDRAKLNLDVLQRQVGRRPTAACGRACRCCPVRVRARAPSRACGCVHSCLRQPRNHIPHPPVSRGCPRPAAKPPRQSTASHAPRPRPARAPSQAKGLQAEYARATGAAASGASSGDDEAARLRGRVDALIREKGALQATVDEALAAKKLALAQVEAISVQSKVGGGAALPGVSRGGVGALWGASSPALLALLSGPALRQRWRRGG